MTKKITKSWYLKLLSLTIFLLFSLILISCGDENSIKTKDSKQDPFATLKIEPLSKEKDQHYQHYQLTENDYKAVVSQLKNTQKETKKQGGKLTFGEPSYDKNNKNAEIKDIIFEANLDNIIDFPMSQFKDSKNLKVDWYDGKNKLPHYVKVAMADVLIPTEAFLTSQDGKDYSQFLKNLGVDHTKLENWSDLSYEYNAKTSQLAIAINDNLNKLFDLRFVLKLDGVSKQVFELLESDEAIQNPGMLLGMVSAVRLEEIYVKMKMEKNIDEIISAMPKEDAIEARDNYEQSKKISDEELQKQLGGAYTLEQIKQYRAAWFNFLEQKKPLIISVNPDVPQGFTALFSGFMMAQQNPKMASGLIKQLNLSISN